MRYPLKVLYLLAPLGALPACSDSGGARATSTATSTAGSGPVGGSVVSPGSGSSTSSSGNGAGVAGAHAAGESVGGAGAQSPGLGGSAAGEAAAEEPSPIEPSEALTHYAPGTRLKIMVEELEGGPTIVEGFYDSEYDLPCEFTLLEDGLYCIPRRDMRGSFKGYADSKCQTRLLQAEEGCQPTNLFRHPVGVCSSPEVIYEYKQGTSDVPAFDLTASGSCEATGEVVPAATARVGVAVDPKRFVRGIERIVPTTNGRLGLRVIEAEEGAYAPLQLVDTRLGFPCRNVPQHERCEPLAVASLTNIFTDAACMNPSQIGVSSRRPECGEIEWIRDTTNGAAVEFYRAGGEFKGDAWRQRTVQQTKECVARADTGYSYELGAPLMTALTTPASALLGGGRVQAVGLGEGADPLYLDSFRLWDTDRAEDCSAAKVDGVTLCVPLDRPSFDSDALQYADSACSEPLVQCRTGNCEQTYWYKLASVCTGSDLFSSIIRALQPATASVYELDATGQCVGPVAADRAWTWEVVPVEQSGLAHVTETILP